MNLILFKDIKNIDYWKLGFSQKQFFKSFSVNVYL